MNIIRKINGILNILNRLGLYTYKQYNDSIKANKKIAIAITNNLAEYDGSQLIVYPKSQITIGNAIDAGYAEIFLATKDKKSVLTIQE